MQVQQCSYARYSFSQQHEKLHAVSNNFSSSCTCKMITQALCNKAAQRQQCWKHAYHALNSSDISNIMLNQASLRADLCCRPSCRGRSMLQTSHTKGDTKAVCSESHVIHATGLSWVVLYSPDIAASYSPHRLIIEILAELVQNMDLDSRLCIFWIHCRVLTNVHHHLMDCSVFLWMLWTAQTGPPAMANSFCPHD